MVELTSTIGELGFPVAIFIVAITTIIYIIKKEEKRQILTDKRYDELTNKFVDTITKISDDNNMVLKELSDNIHSFTEQFHIQHKK